jgi:hypothetical protein
MSILNDERNRRVLDAIKKTPCMSKEQIVTATGLSRNVAGRTSNHYWKRDLKDRQAAPTLITFECETFFP